MLHNEVEKTNVRCWFDSKHALQLYHKSAGWRQLFWRHHISLYICTGWRKHISLSGGRCNSKTLGYGITVGDLELLLVVSQEDSPRFDRSSKGMRILPWVIMVNLRTQEALLMLQCKKVVHIDNLFLSRERQNNEFDDLGSTLFKLMRVNRQVSCVGSNICLLKSCTEATCMLMLTNSYFYASTIHEKGPKR
jgi:hypothetical protein